MTNSPDRKRYERARQEISAHLEATTAKRNKLSALDHTLQKHQPEADLVPECDSCGAEWPCEQAQDAMTAVERMAEGDR